MPQELHALVVEDDADSARMLSALVSSNGYTASTVACLQDARRVIATRRPDVVLLDLFLPDGNGMALLDDTHLLADTVVVLMTGHGSMASSIDALRRGAADYLVKPVDHARLRDVLQRRMPPAARRLQHPAADMVGTSLAMQQVRAEIDRVAASNAPVLLYGESGTGKELAARGIHDRSRRAGLPFVPVNCGAFPTALVESLLFGHERGSFTGADRPHAGLFEQADGGTLFLDEFTELPAEVQVKLLRVLEDGRYRRLGSTRERHGDVRIVAATNRHPVDAVASGKLLQDLYWRVAVYEIGLPPLRERASDIPALARHLASEVSLHEGRAKRLSPGAVAELAGRRWAGNVRELRNAVYRAWIASPGDTIEAGSLPAPHAWPGAAAPAPAAAAPAAHLSLAEIERQHVLATWERCNRNREQTAAQLGISTKSLYNRLRSYRS
jgi:DNA-binding NtrC family response regulator